MNRIWESLILGMSLLGIGFACHSTGGSQESRNPSEGRVPEFIMNALSSPGASKPGVFIGKDGAITRYAVQLGKEAIPEWLHAMADERIGKGEDMTYEAEVYPDGSEVYEIYRIVGGKEKQLSVAHRDRSLRYIGTQMGDQELPEKVQTTLHGVKGLKAEKVIVKQGPAFSEVHVRGTINGVPHRVRVGGDGRLLSVQRRIAGEFEVVHD